MFSRRKHKLSDEDEPLVPHGLIWQATDEPMPPDQGPNAKAEPLEMPPRPEDPPRPKDSIVPRKLGSISPPLAWPSAEVQKIVRPAPEEAKAAAPNIAPTPNIVPTLPNKAVSVSSNEPSSRAMASKELNRSLLIVRRANQSIVHALSGLRVEIESSIPIWHEKLQVFGNNAIRRARQLKMRAGVASALCGRLWRESNQFCREEIRPALLRASLALQRARNHKVRIRIQAPAAARFRGVTQRAVSQWQVRRNTLDRDARLWTSMGMAALSALLAVTFISVIREQTRPVHAVDHSTIQREQMIPAVEPILRPSAKAAPTITQPRQTAVQKPTPIARQPLSTKPKTARRAVRRDEDDYVAADTYTYYGPKGKTSH